MDEISSDDLEHYGNVHSNGGSKHTDRPSNGLGDSKPKEKKTNRDSKRDRSQSGRSQSGSSSSRLEELKASLNFDKSMEPARDVNGTRPNAAATHPEHRTAAISPEPHNDALTRTSKT